MPAALGPVSRTSFSPAQPVAFRKAVLFGSVQPQRAHQPPVESDGSKHRTPLAMALSKAIGIVFSPVMGVSRFNLNRYDVKLPNLPKSWEGAKIVQVSDLHDYELLNPKYLKKIVETVQQAQPDVIIFSGDLIHHGRKFLDHARDEFLKPLLAPRQDGSRPLAIAAMGNHDYMDDACGEAAKKAMQEAGFTVLVNDSTRIRRNAQDEPLTIAAVDDYHYGVHDVDGTLSKERPHIAISHNPRFADDLAQHKNAPALILSGDTHGGHFFHWSVNWLRSGVFKKKVPKYRAGWYALAPDNQGQPKSLLYVHSGLGSAFFSRRKPKYDFAGPPLRLGSTPEIAIFTLGRAEAKSPAFRPAAESPAEKPDKTVKGVQLSI